MNLPTAPPVEPRIFQALEEKPNLLILDNLETPWELDRPAVEEFLGMLACRQSALVVSVHRSESLTALPGANPFPWAGSRPLLMGRFSWPCRRRIRGRRAVAGSLPCAGNACRWPFT